jgi:hypothetical protein
LKDAAHRCRENLSTSPTTLWRMVLQWFGAFVAKKMVGVIFLETGRLML